MCRMMLPDSHLHDEHVLRFSLEVHAAFSLVDAQILLLSAQSLLSVQNDEDVRVRPRRKHIACECGYFIRNN